MLASGVTEEELIAQGVEAAMERLDAKCTVEEFNLLEIMLAGRAVNAILEDLFPRQSSTATPTTGEVVVLASLQGDVHDLGKNLVATILRAKGFAVVDAGKNCSVQQVCDVALAHAPLAVGISGLLTLVIPQLRELRGALERAGLGSVKLLAGGAALKQFSPDALRVDFVADSVFDGVRYLQSLRKASPPEVMKHAPSPLEELAAAVEFRPTSRLPVIAQIFGHTARRLGIPLLDYVRSGEVVAEAQLAAQGLSGGQCAPGCLRRKQSDPHCGRSPHPATKTWHLDRLDPFFGLRDASGSASGKHRFPGAIRACCGVSPAMMDSRLHVSIGGKHREFSFQPGETLREVLQATDCRPQAGCAGHGSCGLCRVKVLRGEFSPPTPVEQLTLGSRLARGIRLACQTQPLGEAAIEIENPAPAAGWRGPWRGELYTPERRPHPTRTLPEWGLAVDIGTTNLTLSLFHLPSATRCASRIGRNGQGAQIGADIMTRLQKAHADEARQAHELLLESLREGLQDLLLAEGLSPRVIGRVAVVGNTAMIALLSRKNFAKLLDPAMWSQRVDNLPVDFEGWAEAWHLNPEVEFIVPPALGGFVGSDVLADLLVLDLPMRTQPVLLLDCGTNSEMALWDGHKLWVTSAAGGPAFEGMGLSCGLPIGPGAIWRLEVGAEAWEAEVLGGARPGGLCGSGLVDALALLRERGEIDIVGRLNRQITGAGNIRIAGDGEFSLTSRDVDLLARAKAAIGTGLRLLLQRAGLSFTDLEHVFVAGNFGRRLHVGHARQIGLLPDLPEELFSLPGNTALAGAEDFLLDPSPRRWESLLQELELVNLADQPQFSQTYLEELFLRPMGQEAESAPPPVAAIF